MTSSRRGVKLPPAETLLALRDQRYSSRAIAEMYDATESAVNQKIAAYRRRENLAPAERLLARRLPWEVSTAHMEGSRIYRAVRAYAKQQRGEQLTAEETSMATGVREFAMRQDLVMFYDKKDGFQWRDRRPDDKDILVPE